MSPTAHAHLRRRSPGNGGFCHPAPPQHAPRTEIVTRTRAELDLTDQAAVECSSRPSRSARCTSRPPGSEASTRTARFPADFAYENLMIEANVIRAAHDHDVDRLLFLGSSCIYPKFADQPIVEESLLTGPLEPTNEAYAIAKIAGISSVPGLRIQFGRDYRAVMPTNLYGPGDDFHPTAATSSRASIRASTRPEWPGDVVVVWGTGRPLDGSSCTSTTWPTPASSSWNAPERSSTRVGGDLDHINVGTGTDLTIRELAELIADTVGFDGELEFDPSMPDGTPRKLLDVHPADRARLDAVDPARRRPPRGGRRLPGRDPTPCAAASGVQVRCRR